jgi:hypothetical protein
MDIIKSLHKEQEKQARAVYTRISSLEDDRFDFYKSFTEIISKSIDKEDFEKSFSSELADKFPEGGWRTVNGARVFINNGKVIAGLGGFNGAIDSFFSEKGKDGGGKVESRENPKGIEKEIDVKYAIMQKALNQFTLIDDNFDRKRAIYNFTLSMAGDGNKNKRVAIYSELTGEKQPVAKSGVNNILDAITKIVNKMRSEQDIVEIKQENKTNDKPVNEKTDNTEVNEKTNDKPSNETKQRFSKVKEIDRKDIITNTKLFQGRTSEFSEDSVNKIVAEGFDKTNDPIVVWFDKDKDKYTVISGHSRFEASKRLYEKGDKSLETMPVKEFMGDKEEAASYAILESNRASTQEGMTSDVKAVSKMLKDGYNRTEMLKYIKPKSYLESVINYAQLNPKGKFMEYLDSPSNKSFPYLERNASWVGELRKQYGNKLTDQQENEIFEYMYQSGATKGLKQTKDQFVNLIGSKISKLDYDSSKPLNLNNVVSTSALTNPAKVKIKELQDDVVYFNNEIGKKQDLIIRARQNGQNDLVEKFEKIISDATKKVISLKGEIYKLESDSKKVENATTKDLFS